MFFQIIDEFPHNRTADLDVNDVWNKVLLSLHAHHFDMDHLLGMTEFVIDIVLVVTVPGVTVVIFPVFIIVTKTTGETNRPNRRRS